MAQSWFETKVKYIKTIPETGIQKAVTEPYLVEAFTFTEAEARITEEMEPYISGEFSVKAAKIENFDDILFNENGDRWYKIKYNELIVDEKTGKEKKIAVFTLVQATELKQALDLFLQSMKSVNFDFEVVQVTETALMDVFSVNGSSSIREQKQREQEREHASRNEDKDATAEPEQ